MKLSEIFDALQYGELFNVSISGEIDQPKGIRQQDWPLLIYHINMALTDMHTRLDLKEIEVTIQQYDILSFYKLDSAYAASNSVSTEPIKYIIDSLDKPFEDNIIRINTIYDEVGEEYFINDETRAESLFLPNHNTIQVPLPYDDNTMFVLCKANHVKLDPNLTDPTQVEVDIPQYCLEPLLAYVASRVHSSRISADAQAIAVSLLAKYNLMLDNLKMYNVTHNDPNNTNIKGVISGWV